MSLLLKIIKFFVDNPVPQEQAYTGPVNFPKCPTCDINLIERSLLNCSFFVCDECSGIWVNSDTFPLLLKKEEEDLEGLFAYTEQNLTIKNKFMSPRDLRPCPVCSNMMMNIQFDASSGIWIDHCCFNHGIWLDAGEINLILQYRKMLKEYGGKIPGQVIGISEEFKKEMEGNVGGFNVSANPHQPYHHY
ncbi:MAG: zf-TFIIB domain-containing protein [Candidatus Eremiobacterota bacterium]